MKIALKCAKCGGIHMSEDDDLCLEIDFLHNKISYICRSKDCGHMNEMDLRNWSEVSKNNPLPAMRFSR